MSHVFSGHTSQGDTKSRLHGSSWRNIVVDVYISHYAGNILDHPFAGQSEHDPGACYCPVQIRGRPSQTRQSWSSPILHLFNSAGWNCSISRGHFRGLCLYKGRRHRPPSTVGTKWASQFTTPIVKRNQHKVLQVLVLPKSKIYFLIRQLLISTDTARNRWGAFGWPRL